jgi:hypothetical protein
MGLGFERNFTDLQRALDGRGARIEATREEGKSVLVVVGE